MNYVRAFIAGLVLPSIILPIILFTAVALGEPQVLDVPFLHIIPLLWGVWNVLYVAYFKEAFPKNAHISFALAGGILGLLVAVTCVFLLRLPNVLGIPHAYQYDPLIAAPIVYAILWCFVVRPLNHLLAVKD